jgi:hypothetical protein
MFALVVVLCCVFFAYVSVNAAGLVTEVEALKEQRMAS